MDIMLGIGGTPEAVIAAAALKCMGGHFQVGRLVVVWCSGLVVRQDSQGGASGRGAAG